MDYNTISNLEACRIVVDQVAKLLYYSHIPTAVVALFVGFFVLINGPKNLANRILFSISFLFSLWSMLDLVIWLNYDKNTLIMFAWSFFAIITSLMFILSLYFVYVFIDKKDISFFKKIVFGVSILPIILLTATKFNLGYFDTVDCVSVEGKYFTNYYLFLSFVVFVWILLLAIFRYRKAEPQTKKEIVLLTIGIELFLFSFLFAIYISSLLMDWGAEQYVLEQYGFFGMPVFLGFLAYLIVKFKAFEIKLLGAQALVVAQFIMIASMFAFAKEMTSRILIGVTLLGTAIMGWNLIRSVKLEVQRKEELQMMSDKLASANDQLRKLDNAKSEFISIASHQLRTPLTAIKGFVSLLLEGSYGKVTAKQEDALNKVYTSNDRLVHLVEDLLNISRIESGRMEFKLAPTKIADICQEVVDTLLMKARERKLDLDWKMPDAIIPELVVDGTKVREVISNMVDNALKYTEKGGVKVRLEQIADAVRVTVSDTGIGIPAEELPYLFSKFSRGKDTSRLNTGGTGLGLYVGKAMIEQNGGKIWAESEGAGLGSRFIIELPVVQSEELMKRWGQSS